MNTAERMLAWIETHCAAGRTCYLSTYLRSVSITQRSLDAHLIRVKNGQIETRHGKSWLRHIGSRLTAS
jgi:hypothetical protein